MQSPVELSFANTGPSPAVEARVRRRVARLERLFDHLASCHVWIDANHLSATPGRPRRRRLAGAALMDVADVTRSHLLYVDWGAWRA